MEDLITMISWAIYQFCLLYINILFISGDILHQDNIKKKKDQIYDISSLDQHIKRKGKSVRAAPGKYKSYLAIKRKILIIHQVILNIQEIQIDQELQKNVNLASKQIVVR